MGLVGEADSNPIDSKGPRLLEEAILPFYSPFSAEKSDNLGTDLQHRRLSGEWRQV